jgi:hypothetical protein
MVVLSITASSFSNLLAENDHTSMSFFFWMGPILRLCSAQLTGWALVTILAALAVFVAQA